MVLPKILLFAAAAVCLSVAVAQVSQDEAPIRDLVEQMEAGWNAGSGEKFAAPFAEGADYVVVNGMHVKKRVEIAKGHQMIFDAIYKDSHNEGTVESVRFIRPDVALVHARWALKFKVDGKEETGNARSTLLVVKNKDKWEIESFQNTSIMPARG